VDDTVDNYIATTISWRVSHDHCDHLGHSKHMFSHPGWGGSSMLVTLQICCFATVGLRIWNSLPEQLRQPDITFGQFKRSLKTFMFG